PSTSTSGDIFEDKMMTITDTLVAIRSTRPRTTSVVICDVEEEPRRETPVPTVQSQDKGKSKIVEPEPTPKKPIKAQIQKDAEITQRLFEEDQAQYPIIDWEFYSEDTRRYWRIIRDGNHTEAYQIFADMLKKFDKDGLVKLWDLVKERFSTTEPTDDKEKEL
ncbi:hypothetical protein Tco_1443653, partial [Tanacetum coccineum]